MGWGLAAMVVGQYIGQKSAKKARRQQMSAAQRALEEQREAREEMRKYLEPYTMAGETAMNEYLAGLGLPQNASGIEFSVPEEGFVREESPVNGFGFAKPFSKVTNALKGVGEGIEHVRPEYRGPADIRASIEASPQFQMMQQAGEQALLEHAGVTGGPRSGVASALAKYRPGLIGQLYDQRMGGMGRMAGLGQASAAGAGSAGMQIAGNMADIYGDMNAISAGSKIANQERMAKMLMSIPFYARYS